MSSYHKLKRKLEQIEETGGIVEMVEIAEDIQREIIADMVKDADPSYTRLEELKTIQALKDRTRDSIFGLAWFEGYPVISKPSGTGVNVVYH
jgi:hypothetical protein